MTTPEEQDDAVLCEVRSALRMDTWYADATLQRLIDSAFQEFLRFANLKGTADEPPNVGALDPDVINGIVLMVEADFNGDPAQRQAMRESVLDLWWPHRVNWGSA